MFIPLGFYGIDMDMKKQNYLIHVESFSFVHLSDMDSHSARAYTNICRSAISE